MTVENVIKEARDFFENTEKYNFYVYDNRGESVGDSKQNDTLENAVEAFEKIVSRLQAGKYTMKAKKPKGEAANNSLTKFDFIITSTKPSNAAMNFDEMYKVAYERAKFDLEFQEMKKKVERFEKYEKILEKLLENEKTLIKAITQLTDDDEDNDESGLSKLDNAKDTVLSLMDVFDNMKKH